MREEAQKAKTQAREADVLLKHLAAFFCTAGLDSSGFIVMCINKYQ